MKIRMLLETNNTDREQGLATVQVDSWEDFDRVLRLLSRNEQGPCPKSIIGQAASIKSQMAVKSEASTLRLVQIVSVE